MYSYGNPGLTCLKPQDWQGSYLWVSKNSINPIVGYEYAYEYSLVLMVLPRSGFSFYFSEPALVFLRVHICRTVPPRSFGKLQQVHPHLYRKHRLWSARVCFKSGSGSNRNHLLQPKRYNHHCKHCLPYTSVVQPVRGAVIPACCISHQLCCGFADRWGVLPRQRSRFCF